MFRFLKLWLKPDYEECKGCEAMKWLLQESNQEKKDLLELVMSLVHPQPQKIEPREVSTSPVPIIPRNMTWSRRRHMLEERDRIENQLRKNSPFIANSSEDDKDRKEAVEALEAEIKSLEREVSPNAG